MPHEFPLWPPSPPHALGNNPERDIPTLTSYLPEKKSANMAAVVLFPGGGYWELMDYEGRDFALWLNERGIAAFVLKYRLACNGYHHPAITEDGMRAVRHVRAHAVEWNIDPARIGIMGSSAGGHLASIAMVHGDAGNPQSEDPVERAGSRPDFGILCYAVISMELQPMKNLTGEAPSRDLVRHLCTELHVTRETPPCFIWHTQDDKVVKAEHALRFASALQAHGVSFALHIYESGTHGMGLGVYGYNPGDSKELHPWTLELSRWLVNKGLTQ